MTVTNIKTEFGENVDLDFLLEMIEEVNSEDSFVNRVNYAITDERSFVSEENNQKLREFYKLFKIA